MRHVNYDLPDIGDARYGPPPRLEAAIAASALTVLLTFAATERSLGLAAAAILLGLLAGQIVRFHRNWGPVPDATSVLVRRPALTLLRANFYLGSGLSMVFGVSTFMPVTILGWVLALYGLLLLREAVTHLLDSAELWPVISRNLTQFENELTRGLPLAPPDPTALNLGKFVVYNQRGEQRNLPAPDGVSPATWELMQEHVTEVAALDLYDQGHLSLQRGWIVRPWVPEIRTALFQAMARGWVNSETGEVTPEGKAVVYCLRKAAANPQLLILAELRHSLFQTIQQADE